MENFQLIPRQEIRRIWGAHLQEETRLALVADMCRANALTMVKIAGSGHLGSSLSAMDLVVYLYYREMNTADLGTEHPDRDIYFSSKGHDVPGLYAVLYSFGILPKEKILSLRRLGGLDGHPDVEVPGVEVNSGSLGMGISKGRGMAVAKHLSGRNGRVFVLTGDGELQEGQIYEALQTAAHQRTGNLIVIVDHNKVQSDKKVEEITGLGDLEGKFRAFGWHVRRCDGHDFLQIRNVMEDFKKILHQPKVLIADTIKGKGISFMEHPRALRDGAGLYLWHSGAPDDENFEKGHNEIMDRVQSLLVHHGLAPLHLENIDAAPKASSGVTKEYVADAYGAALEALAEKRKDMVVLDADLASDCRVRGFEKKYPDRFLENGIAEQDMVSMAGGLALQGYLPVVNSFAAFLSSRANEQIYTNAGEGTRIIYVCHYAGLIPAGPGKSHQSIRDISLFAALPNFEILQPCNATETTMALRYCVMEASANCMLRLVIGPSPGILPLPPGYQLKWGRGVPMSEGKDAILFGYGPVMLYEALKAREILAGKGIFIKVVNMPWLNRVDTQWLCDIVGDCTSLFVVEDHSPSGGLADRLLNALNSEHLLQGRKFKCFGVEGFPACGTPSEALNFHGLDGESLAKRVLEDR
jgi:transketolase